MAVGLDLLLVFYGFHEHETGDGRQKLRLVCITGDIQLVHAVKPVQQGCGGIGVGIGALEGAAHRQLKDQVHAGTDGAAGAGKFILAGRYALLEIVAAHNSNDKISFGFTADIFNKSVLLFIHFIKLFYYSDYFHRYHPLICVDFQ